MKTIALLALAALLAGCSTTPGNIDDFNARWNAFDKRHGTKSCEVRPISQTHSDIICR